jgi:hypothetical protein
VAAQSLRTGLALASAILTWLFFDQAKHNALLSSGAGFLDDPYDAVGSFAIQCGAATAAVGLLWLIAESWTQDAGYLHRAALITGVTTSVTGVADLAGQLVNPNQNASVWIWVGIIALIVFGGAGIALNVRHRAGHTSSLLKVFSPKLAFARPLVDWADGHVVWTGIGIGLTSGVALLLSHLLLEGGPSSTVDLVLLSLFLIGGEGTFVAFSWIAIGSWLKIHRGVRLGRHQAGRL